MAIEANITKDDGWYLGEDKSLAFTVYQSDGTTPQDMTGWALSWRIKKKRTDADASAILTKTTASGISISTSVATVTVADTDTDALTARGYYHELKRTDAGFEAVLSQGVAVLQRGVHHA